MDSLEPTNLAGNLVRNYFGQRFWTIFACLELKYNELKCFGASALGFCQTEKWVSVKITMVQELPHWDRPGSHSDPMLAPTARVGVDPPHVSLSPVSQRWIQSPKSGVLCSFWVLLCFFWSGSLKWVNMYLVIIANWCSSSVWKQRVPAGADTKGLGQNKLSYAI